ncbi:MAG: LytTR family transcriptional regulator, partial [Clostridia bacterium]|nr:LytTR family transcriptional regulator [Clostridia bacterium]
MKIQFIRDEEQEEEKITISYSTDSEVVRRLKRYVEELNKEYSKMELYQGDTQYYMEVDNILFFETEDNKIISHTRDEVYEVKYRL